MTVRHLSLGEPSKATAQKLAGTPLIPAHIKKSMWGLQPISESTQVLFLLQDMNSLVVLHMN